MSIKNKVVVGVAIGFIALAQIACLDSSDLQKSTNDAQREVQKASEQIQTSADKVKKNTETVVDLVKEVCKSNGNCK